MATSATYLKNGILVLGSGAIAASSNSLSSSKASTSGSLYYVTATFSSGGSEAGSVKFFTTNADLDASGVVQASSFVATLDGFTGNVTASATVDKGEPIGTYSNGVLVLTKAVEGLNKVQVNKNGTGIDLSSYSGTKITTISVEGSSATVVGSDSGVVFEIAETGASSNITGGAGNDTYSVAASSLVITDNGGKDTYNFNGDTTKNVTKNIVLTDNGEDVDAYKFKGIVSSATITDGGGDQSWDFTGRVSTSTINSGAGADTYTFTTGASALTMTDAGGEDVYIFKGSANSISINNILGADSIDFTSRASGVSLAGADITLNVSGASALGIDATKMTGVLTANLKADASIAGSDQNDVINVSGGAKDVLISGGGSKVITIDADAKVDGAGLSGDNVIFNINKSGASAIGGSGSDTFKLKKGVVDVSVSSQSGDDKLVVGGKNKVNVSGKTIKTIDVSTGSNTVSGAKASAAIEWTVSGSAASNELTASPNGDTFNVTGGTKNTIYGAAKGKETVNVNGTGIELYLADMNVSSSNDVVTLTGTKNTIGLSSGFAGELEISASGNTVAVDGKYDGPAASATISATAANFTYDGSKAKSKDVGVTVNVTKDAANAVIKGGKGQDIYNLEAVPATINGGTGKDTYNVNGELANLVIEHNDGDAVINVNEAGAGSKITGPAKYGATYTLAGSKVTLEAGSGADVITASADAASINAGAGHDEVVVVANQTATVNVGAGNDSITVNAGAAVAATLGDGKDVVDLGKGATVTIADLDTSHSDRITFGTNTADSAVVMAQDANSVTLAFYAGSSALGTVVSNKGLNSIKDIKVNSTENKTIRELLGGADSVPATQKDTLPSSATAKAVDLGKLTDGSGYAYIGPSGVVTDATGSSAGVGVAKNYSYVADPNGTPVNISAAGANHAWNITGSKGSEMITASSFGDTLNGSGGKDSIVGGAGADYIYAHNGDLVKLGGAGTGVDTVDVTGTEANATVTVHGSISPEDVIKVGNVNNVAVDTAQAGVLTATNSNGDTVSLDLDMNLGNTGYGAHVSDGVNADKFIGWVDKTTAGLLDARGYNQDLTLYGNTNQLADTVIGGNGRDTIFGSAGDSVYGAEGNDLITLADNTGAQRENIGLTKTGGVDTVVGFKTGFDATSDQVAFFEDDRGVGSAKIDANGNVIVSAGNGELQINGAAATDDSGKANGAAFFMIKDKNGESSAVALGTGQSTISADATTGEYADIYLGVSGPSGTTVDFTNNNSALALDLANTGKYGSAASPITFVGITNVKGAANQRNTIIGSADMEDVIYGGANGHNSLWGGGIGNDVLVGQQDSDDYFYYGNGEGNDTIQGFTVGNNKQSDKVVLFSGYATGAERRVESDGTNVLNVYWSDGEVLTINKITSGDSLSSGHGVDDVYRYGSYAAGDTRLAKVGYADTVNTFAYDSEVTEYYGNSDDSDIGNNDVLTVGAEVTAARIYLDGSSYDGAVNTKYRGITNIDASKNKGNVELAGGQLADSIVGGQGANSIWGGAGSANDTLVGGTGKNTFYFNFGEGNDTIMNSGASDKVVIYGANIADAVGELNGSDYVATLTDGSRLTINNIQNGFKASFMDKTVTYSDGRFA